MKAKKYIEIFAREAEDLLQRLRQGILEMEEQGLTADRVHDLLRHAHTLKGSARMLDLETLGLVAHRTEGLFKELEAGERSLDPQLTDLLLLATDALEALIAQAHSGGGIDVNVEAVLAGLESGVLPNRDEESGTFDEPRKPEEPGKTEKDSVRTSVEKLDQLVNLLGELLIIRRMMEERSQQMGQIQKQMDQFLRRLKMAENYRKMKGILDDFGRLNLSFERDVMALNYLSEDLHVQAMELRMLPLATITGDLSRMARDLAREQSKKVRLSIRGDEVEFDRMMLEAVRPMLLHMLRNAVDHGIEEPEDRLRQNKPEIGVINLTARYEAGFVRLDLQDDGRGIDPQTIRETALKKKLISEDEANNLSDDDAIYLILRPGFSTRDFITDVSGRGVGMNVVKEMMDRVKGNLVIHSKPGQGTEMTLTLPLTMVVVTALVIECEDERYAIPLHYVAEILRVSEKEILTEGGREVIRVRGTTLPLISLREILGLPQKQAIRVGGRVTALMLRFREQQMACLVTKSMGTQDLVAKGMGKQLKSVRFFSGATILGDGSPALILSIPDLFQTGLSGQTTRLRQEFETSRIEAKRGKILVVDDSITTRTMEKNILETQGYDVTVAISGHDALDKLAGTRFDLIVSDVEMPGMNGFELTEKIKSMENTQDIPVIIVTSLASDNDRRKGIEVGAQAYIVKGSFDQGTLLETVETLIG